MYVHRPPCVIVLSSAVASEAEDLVTDSNGRMVHTPRAALKVNRPVLHLPGAPLQPPTTQEYAGKMCIRVPVV